jgi:hypothetical protein
MTFRYACHYCGRTDGKPTKDHKVPKSAGGGDGANIIMSCKMCNMIKGSLKYEFFVSHFQPFLAENKEHYLAADADSLEEIKRWQRAFSLHLRRHLDLSHPLRPLHRKSKESRLQARRLAQENQARP